MLEDAPHVSTGWHGLNPTPEAGKEIRGLYLRPPKMQEVLEKLRPVPADL